MSKENNATFFFTNYRGKMYFIYISLSYKEKIQF